MTEQEIIAKLSLGQRKAPSLHGIGDDGAKVVEHRVVTCDTMVEGIHWDKKLTPADVGWKIVAINASDIGAMGGLPEWCTLSYPFQRQQRQSGSMSSPKACEQH